MLIPVYRAMRDRLRRGKCRALISDSPATSIVELKGLQSTVRLVGTGFRLIQLEEGAALTGLLRVTSQPEYPAAGGNCERSHTWRPERTQKDYWATSRVRIRSIPNDLPGLGGLESLMTCSFSRIPLKDSNYRPKDLNRRTRRCFDANETSSLVQCGWNSTSLLLAATMGLAVGSLSNSSLIPFEGNVLLDHRSSAPTRLYLYLPIDECSRERRKERNRSLAGRW